MNHTARIPPQALDIEKSILGSALIERNVLEKFNFELKEDHFYSTANKKIFNYMLKMIKSNKDIDIVTLIDEIQKNKELEDVGGECYILELVENPTVKNISQHIKILKEKFELRELITVGCEVMDMGFSEDLPIEIIGKIDQRLCNLQDEKVNRTFTAHETIPPTIEEIQNRMSGKSKPIKTNIAALDDAWGGLFPGEFTVIGARPGMGKSALMCHLMTSIKEPGLIISLEMSKEQLTERILSKESGVNKSKLRIGNVNQHEMDEIQMSLGKISNFKYFLNDYPYMNIYMIRSLIAQHVRNHKIKYVIVDYLQMIRDTGKFKDKRLETEEKSTMLKNISKEFNIQIIALAQLSRNVESRTNKRPMSSDLKESGSIEQDAHNIHFIYRDEVYNKETDLKGITEIITTKMREGILGAQYLRFVPEYAMFESIINVSEVEKIKEDIYSKSQKKVVF